MSWQVEVLDREVVYDGFFRMERYRLRHGLFAGGLSPEVVRELLRRQRVAAVLPYDPVAGAVVLVEQFRIGAIDEPGEAWLLETVAGVADPGETPEAVARRELQEEAGLQAEELLPICDYYPSPGGSSERVSLYCARVDSSRAGGIHGLDSEHEDIRVHVVPVDEALGMLDSGILDSAMPIIALQWLALHREWIDDLWQ